MICKFQAIVGCFDNSNDLRVQGIETMVKMSMSCFSQVREPNMSRVTVCLPDKMSPILKCLSFR
jgi:hypothetical protein